jgi:hypothetical protein
MHAQGGVRGEGFTRLYLAMSRRMASALDEAALEVDEALPIVEPNPPLPAYALATLARVRLDQGPRSTRTLLTGGIGVDLQRLVAARGDDDPPSARVRERDLRGGSAIDAAPLRHPLAARREALARRIGELLAVVAGHDRDERDDGDHDDDGDPHGAIVD